MTFKLKENRSFIIDKGVSDIIKFLCCILIALHHYSLHHPSLASTSLFWDILSKQGGFLGVGMYFFLSGYGLTKSWAKRPLSIGLFIKRRLMKVYVPAVVVSLIWVVAIFFMNRNGIHIADMKRPVDVECLPKDLAGTLIFRFHDYILWFIPVILMLYSAFLIYKRISRRSVAFIVFAACISLCFLVTRMYIGKFATVSIPIFALGVITAENSDLTGKRIVPLAVCSLLFAVISSVILRNNHLWVHGMINFAAIVILIILFSFFDIHTEKLPKWVGGVSYDVYLTHNKVLMTLCRDSASISPAMFLLCSAFLAAISYLIRKIDGTL